MVDSNLSLAARTKSLTSRCSVGLSRWAQGTRASHGRPVWNLTVRKYRLRFHVGEWTKFVDRTSAIGCPALVAGIPMGLPAYTRGLAFDSATRGEDNVDAREPRVSGMPALAVLQYAIACVDDAGEGEEPFDVTKAAKDSCFPTRLTLYACGVAGSVAELTDAPIVL